MIFFYWASSKTYIQDLMKTRSKRKTVCLFNFEIDGANDKTRRGNAYKKKNNKDNKYYLDLAKKISLKSPDPNTKVGCVIKTMNNKIIKNYNDLPKYIKHSKNRLQRPEKYKWIEHAERNTIFIAAKKGLSLDKSSMYLNWYPCIDCARAIIQSGISNIYCDRRPDYNDERWGEQFKTVTQMLKEASVNVKFL